MTTDIDARIDALEAMSRLGLSPTESAVADHAFDFAVRVRNVTRNRRDARPDLPPFVVGATLDAELTAELRSSLLPPPAVSVLLPLGRAVIERELGLGGDADG